MFYLLRVFGLLALAGSFLGCGSKDCPGQPVKYSCIIGGCSHDVVTDPVCSDGTFVCPSGSVAQSSCGGCFGLIPPGCTCGDAGITCPDASTDH
jgi:hypothetical protein